MPDETKTDAVPKRSVSVVTLLLVAIVVALLVVALIIFTPLKRYIPGYGDVKEHADFITQLLKQAHSEAIS